MYLNHVGSIDAMHMQFAVDLNLRQRWRDPRLSFADHHGESIDFDHKKVTEIWVPDAYFRNAKSAKQHLVTVPNRFLRISPEGDVIYSQRLSVVLACNMDMKYFPMDNQTCHIELESFGFTTKDVRFLWSNMSVPIAMNNDVELPEFSNAVRMSYQSCELNYPSLGVFPCIEVRFMITREYGFYLIQTFVPNALIVMLSWFSFWLDPHATPARISLGLLTVLTMTTQIAGIRMQLPKVSYVKSIDIWNAVCLTFVFGALLEFAIVNVLVRREPKHPEVSPKKNMETTRTSARSSFKNDAYWSLSRATLNNRSSSTNELPTNNNKADEKDKNIVIKCPHRRKYMLVEKLARITFPISFFVFNIFFWLYSLRFIGA
ncbi:glycine receptor subunit alpha-1-like [Tubulanus polymorphus]|uniref:glycine receptor subunit alpha-1-like n=1 Tax=Tubulanus polymorphus TaxID=672921 RepID=UPI003DA47B64